MGTDMGNKDALRLSIGFEQIAQDLEIPYPSRLSGTSQWALANEPESME